MVLSVLSGVLLTIDIVSDESTPDDSKWVTMVTDKNP